MTDALRFGMFEQIREFSGEYRFLSNFWPARVWLDFVQYPTVEHAYQAAKTHKVSERHGIELARTPGDAKRRGRHVTLRDDWEQIKVAVMLDLIKQKFAPNTVLAMDLKRTGNILLCEGNTWHDNFWGACSCMNCRGKGSNMLGKILMDVRKGL